MLRVLDDLIVPHPLNRERGYEVVVSVVLEAIDYENYITDKLMDRQFIEDHAALCNRGETLTVSWFARWDARMGCW